VRTRAKKFSVAVIALGGALALAGCGTPSSSHTVLGGSTGGVGATAPTTGGSGTTGEKTTGTSTRTTGAPPGSTKATSAPSGTSGGTTPASQSEAPSSPLDRQTLNEIGEQLGALGQSLSQATSDVDNPQGDS
jgi:hypothetical protein